MRTREDARIYKRLNAYDLEDGIGDLITTIDEELDEKLDFEEEDHTQLKYNPIRPIKYPSTERSFLRDESCQSNIIGKDNGKILGIFCYDAKT